MTARSDILITPGELAAALASPTPPLVIDCRPAHEFAAGHIDTAVSLDVWGVSLIDTSDAPLRAFMWMIGHLFANRGVTPDREVVVYEKDSGMTAARVFWFLDYLGHPHVRLLDGGTTAWIAEGHALTTTAIAPVPSTWHGHADPSKLATWSEVRDRLGRADVAIVDTRSAGEYSGEVVRAKRGGAIPGAVNVEWKQNLTPEGRYKPARELQEMYAAAGVTPDAEVVTYCQGGYRAAHTYIALRLIDFPRVRNYTGSWKEWGDREDLPIENTAPKR